MLKTKARRRDLLSTRKIVELTLPFLLGVLAVGVRLSSYRHHMCSISLRFRASKAVPSRERTALVSVVGYSRVARLIFFP
jgi:hypothetical protein